MPATTPSSSCSPSVDPGETGSSPPPTTQSRPKTPERKGDATRPVPNTTPISVGTAIIQKLKIDADESQQEGIDKFEDYIVEDLEDHRVFIDIEVFMNRVLHIPKNWREMWGPTIEQVKSSKPFSTAHGAYCSQCNFRGVSEKEFYKPLVNMGNAIFDVSDSSSSQGYVKPSTPQRYIRNETRKVFQGKMNNLSPDVVAVHKDLLSGEVPRMTWAHPLQVLEVKHCDNALVDGSCMPRLKVEGTGQDPQDGHAHPRTPSRLLKGAVFSAARPLRTKAAFSAPPAPLSRKRRTNEPSGQNRKTRKVDRKSTPGGAKGEDDKRKPRRPQTGENNKQQDAYLQVGRYLLEQFSVPAFRSHATVGLVDRDRIQFYHANRSVILVSSAIEFSSTGERDGLDKFIAIVIGFSRLSLRDSGILHDLDDGRLFRDNGQLPTSKLAPGSVRVLEGHKLEFGGNEKTGPFTLTYGEEISHEPSLIGRGTAVLHAQSSNWEFDLVMKVSWPGSERVAENVFLEEATKTAGSAKDDEWALNHLPNVVYSQDVIFGPDSTLEKVASMFDEPEFVDEGKYTYERRTMRIIIQERLYPLEALTNAKDVAQVLVDIACIHRWLYEHGILHRDLSLNNIMWRMIKEMNKATGVAEKKVCGVLTDYDLSSWTASLTTDYTKTSNQRTGTPPFMARGLLDGTDTLHMYRHDVESLFYVILILATHYEIQAPSEVEDGGIRTRQGLEELPYQAWFDQPSYKTLASFKQTFFSNLEDLDLSPTLESLRGWLDQLQDSFSCGFTAKQEYRRQSRMQQKQRSLKKDQTEESRAKGTPAAFNDETLGGHLTYSALIGPVGDLTGELEGLAVRYPPKSPPTSTDTS